MGELLYQCQDCGRAFQSKLSLSIHRRYCNDTLNKKQYTFNCKKCGKEYTLLLNKFEFKRDEFSKHCSRSCANSRTHTEKTKQKIKNGVLKKIYGDDFENRIPVKAKRILRNKKCRYCGSDIDNETLFCNEWCRELYLIRLSLAHKRGGINGGRKSAYAQRNNRRSKNEILFYDLCKNKFKSVRHNEPIFNGWDADVIIDDLKIAVLWNGKWHYEDICGGLKQIQTRDKIKVNEIIKFGYKPYIIKDMGKYNKNFVNLEFEKFLKYCGIGQR